MSSSTARDDRVVKLREYQAVPSIRSYLIVESEARAITVLSRGDGGDSFRATGLIEDDVLELPEIGISIPVADLYEGVEFNAPPA